MSLKVKIIKQKEFEVDNTPQTHYTVAYKGRVFGISTLKIPASDMKIEDKVLTLPSEIEVLKHTVVDPLTAEVQTYLDIVPKLEIALAVI